MPLPGGFGTPPVGPERERVRLVGGSLFVERVGGDHISRADGDHRGRHRRREFAARTLRTRRVHARSRLLGRTRHAAASATPTNRSCSTGSPPTALGEWYLLGQRAIDEVVASLPDPEATVGRLWPEHFDFGIDLAAAPAVGATSARPAGDAFHAEPYLYVGPWGFALRDPERTGDPGSAGTGTHRSGRSCRTANSTPPTTRSASPSSSSWPESLCCVRR